MTDPKPGRRIGGRKPAKADALTKAEAQRRYVEARRQGMKIQDACRIAKRTEKSVEYWRKTDPEFRARADQAQDLAKAEGDDTASKTRVSFEVFCEQYLDMRLFWHQLQWADLLEKQIPRDLHPSETFIKGDPSRVVINTPPFHAKSMTISIAWVTYRICMDPNVRIIIVSQTEKMAKKFLGAVKNRLTHPRYTRLQQTFGPVGGYQATADSWSATEIYIGAQKRDSGEKDPTVQALGMGGQIYGARADIVVMDDCVTGKNAHLWEDQIEWLNTEVDSRIEEDTGICVVVGTRIRPEDLYVKLRDPEDWSEVDDDVVHDGESEERPWTYLSQPAVLEFSDKPGGWATLWPRSTQPWSKTQPDEGTDTDGTPLFSRWDGTRLARKRRRGARIWSLVYMQQDVADDAVFPAHAVAKCTNPYRNMGRMTPGALNQRRRGMDGLYVVAGLDPAAAGHTAMVVLGIDRETRMRYVLYAVNQARMAPHDMRAKILQLTDDIGIHEWVVEKNAYQGAIARDEALTAPLQSRNVRIREHQTHGNKWDEDLGIAAMAQLFGEYDDSKVELMEPMIELASSQNAHAMKSLVEQLVTWQPNAAKTQKTDLVMALWFAELRAKELTSQMAGGRRAHAPNRFASPRSLERRQVVDLREYASA